MTDVSLWMPEPLNALLGRCRSFNCGNFRALTALHRSSTSFSFRSAKPRFSSFRPAKPGWSRPPTRLLMHPVSLFIDRSRFCNWGNCPSLTALLRLSTSSVFNSVLLKSIFLNLGNLRESCPLNRCFNQPVMLLLVRVSSTIFCNFPSWAALKRLRISASFRWASSKSIRSAPGIFWNMPLQNISFSLNMLINTSSKVFPLMWCWQRKSPTFGDSPEANLRTTWCWSTSPLLGKRWSNLRWKTKGLSDEHYNVLTKIRFDFSKETQGLINKTETAVAGMVQANRDTIGQREQKMQTKTQHGCLNENKWIVDGCFVQHECTTMSLVHPLAEMFPSSL